MIPRILLLQARRADDPMAPHEVACFMEQCALPREAFAVHDLLQGPPSIEDAAAFNAIMVGGSGDFYVSRGDLPRFDELLTFLREVVDRAQPMFASCFGYQALVQALGGEIVHDPDRTEAGTFELALTPEAAEDPLFSQLPSSFLGQMGHKDRATRHPQGVPNLASSALSPFQALRVPGKPIWATQFHPELSRERNTDRFLNYVEAYASYMSAEQREEMLGCFHDSRESSTLLPRFLELTVLSRP